MARQAIFDTELNVVGYELLFRSEQEQSAALFADSNKATQDVLLNNFMAIWEQGERQLMPVYINVGQDFVLNRNIPDLPREDVVLELLEDIQGSDELLHAVAELKLQGYRLALDDFVYQPELEPLIRLAEVIKLDVMELGMEALAEQVKLLRPFNKVLLAEKVETQEEFEQCKALGFSRFQGYFLSRPILMRGKRMPPSNTIIMRVTQQLLADAEVADVEKAILQDPALTYKLLKLINSAQLARSQRITSVNQALNMLGRQALQKWLLLLLASSAEVPAEGVRIALIRARMMELLAEQAESPLAQQAFMVGILASLEMLYAIPLQELLVDLPLEDVILQGVHGKGELGQHLLLARAYEKMQWKLVERLGKPPLNPSQAYLQSVSWVTEIMAAF
ncbi:EAL and HDOD domain-containing protein [Balneatrix alpica]|uniref:EAL and HDOD domain-containing protein n=1 Tax=Balneatrix alpica TaxID=75684 RepID=A0ABV5Z7S8_9GAMM|nr:HDOD domain-containing protein [Balneatrix alpica]